MPKPADIYHADRTQQFREDVITLAREIYIRHEDTSARDALDAAYDFMTSAYHFRETGSILSTVNIEECYNH